MAFADPNRIDSLFCAMSKRDFIKKALARVFVAILQYRQFYLTWQFPYVSGARRN
jgi:hypothetical protein